MKGGKDQREGGREAKGRNYTHSKTHKSVHTLYRNVAGSIR